MRPRVNGVANSSPPSPSSARLIGRERELAACEDVLRSVRAGGQALLLRGGAGVGKTALMQAIRTSALARELRVLSTAGAQAEMTFAFAGLQPLLLGQGAVAAGSRSGGARDLDHGR